MLTQGEARKTKRVRLFTEFISRRLATYAPLLSRAINIARLTPGGSPATPAAKKCLHVDPPNVRHGQTLPIPASVAHV